MLLNDNISLTGVVRPGEEGRELVAPVKVFFGVLRPVVEEARSRRGYWIFRKSSLSSPTHSSSLLLSE